MITISKIVYNSFILPNPEERIFRIFTKLILNFLENKIELQEIRQNYKRYDWEFDEGCIGAVNIKSNLYAAKASWIVRFLKSEMIDPGYIHF